MRLLDLVPADADDLLALEPEELAQPLLQYVAHWEDTHGMGDPGLHNLNNQSDIRSLPRHEEVRRAFSEAWMVLVREGLIAPKPGGSSYHAYFVTRRGRRTLVEESWGNFRTSQHLPAEIVHPKILRETRSEFLRGDFESAVFKAFKAVEVAVREAASLPAGSIGVALMRTAFDVKNGPLTDNSAESGEREAMAHLFAGAFGVFKNPTSHRYAGPDEPAAAVEQIMLASRLMKIVEERQAGSRNDELPE